jgi:uncharacterized RDD family membrane protein YckC
VQPLITGEAVALELRTAGIPSRLLAGVIDGVIQLALFFGIAALTEAVSPSLSGAASSALGIVLLVLVGIGYPVAFEALLRGRTPGKMALGLRVVRDDGGPIGFRQAFVRGLAGAFLERFGITFFVGAFVTMALSSRGKRIGDLLAGTVVLQERVAVRGGQVATMPPQLAGWAAAVDLSGVSNELALSARQFLSRARDLTPAAREELGGRLAAAVVAVVTPPPPAGAPGWAVLSAVLAERRRREELRLGTGGAVASSPPPSATPRWGPTPSYAASSEAPSSYAAPLAGPLAQTPVAPAAPETGPGGFVAPQ